MTEWESGIAASRRLTSSSDTLSMTFFLTTLLLLVPAIWHVHAASPQAGAAGRPRIQVDLITALKEDDALRQWMAGDERSTLETVTEVRLGQEVIAQARIKGCLPDPRGRCDLTVQYAVYRPDGSVFAELKPTPLTSEQAPSLRVTFRDADTGLHRAVVIVRDLNGKRMVRAERIFDVRRPD